MPSSASSLWAPSPVVVQCVGMLVSAAVLLLGVAALAAICARCRSVSRRCTLATGVLALMIALPAWTMHAAFRP